MKDWLDTQSRLSIQIVEDSNKFISYCQKIGIHHQLSQARTSKQKDVAKRMDRFWWRRHDQWWSKHKVWTICGQSQWKLRLIFWIGVPQNPITKSFLKNFYLGLSQIWITSAYLDANHMFIFQKKKQTNFHPWLLKGSWPNVTKSQKPTWFMILDVGR